MFATPRALALSYVDPYVDFTGRVTGYTVVDLRVHGRLRLAAVGRNVWKVERMLLDYPHRPMRIVRRAHQSAAPRYRAFKQEFPDLKPLYYARRDRWTELPPEWKHVEREVLRRRR